MQLLTPELCDQLPRLYAQELQADPMVHLKFFTPDAGWTWYVTEGEREESGDVRFFGYVVGLESEWGYFMLSDLESVRGPLGLSIERDVQFAPSRFNEIKRLERL